jgi:hypothetical protein
VVEFVFLGHFSNSFLLPACQKPAHLVNTVRKLPEQLQPLMGIIGLYLVLIRVILERLNNSFGTVCASIFDEPVKSGLRCAAPSSRQ